LGFDEGVRWLVSLGGSGGVFLFRSINNCFIYRVIFVITNIVIIHKVLNNYCLFFTPLALLVVLTLSPNLPPSATSLLCPTFLHADHIHCPHQWGST